MAGGAQGRQRCNLIEVPPAKRRIATMMNLQVVRAVAGPATPAVTHQRQLAQHVPGNAGNIGIVR